MADTSQPKSPKLRFHKPLPTPTRFSRLLEMPGRAYRLWRRKGLGMVLLRFGQRLVRLGKRGAPPEDKRDTYRKWLADNEPKPEEIQHDAESVQILAYRPLFSFITPVYNPPPDVFRAMLESVRAQTYDHWEICLANGDASNKAVRAICEEFTTKDERIRVTHLERNLGISGNSNCSLQMAQGDFLCFMDHDDVIPRYALAEIAWRLNEKPGTDIVYFDEDLITADGKYRHSPFFKPDWSPELFLSGNYLSHASIRRSLVEQVGRFDTTMDGAQDWDLFLRCTEKTDRIEHIPKVLYHWRTIPGSCAGVGASAKPQAGKNQLRAVENHLHRTGYGDALTYFYRPDIVRCLWPISGRKASIIIPTKDKVDLLKRCVQSILKKTEYPDYEIVIVDTGSQERETWDYYRSLETEPNVQLVRYVGTFNFSAANNFGVRFAAGDLLLFLNNDTEVRHADWLEELARWAERPEIGAVGTKLLYPENTIQHAGVVIGMGGHANHIWQNVGNEHSDWFGSVDWYRNYLAITGACVMMRRDVFEQIGGFDDQYELVFSDIELCLRAVQHGFRVMYTPFAELYHYEGKSRGHTMPLPDCERGAEQFRSWIEAGDPYFNPNLSYGSCLPELKPNDEVSRMERLQNNLEILRGQQRPPLAA